MAKDKLGNDCNEETLMQAASKTSNAERVCKEYSQPSKYEGSLTKRLEK